MPTPTQDPPNPAAELKPSGAPLEIEKPAAGTTDPPERTLDEAALAASMQLFNRAMPPKAQPEEKSEDDGEGEKDEDPEPADPPAKPKRATKTEEKPPTKPAAKPAAKPAKADKEEPAPKAPIKAPARRPEVDPSDIAEAAARGVAEALRKQPEAKRDEPEPDNVTPDDLPEDFAEYFDALAVLPELDAKYKGRNLRKELADAYAKEKSYRKTWEKKNPGETFDPESSDHADFYAGIQPNIRPADLRKADRVVLQREAVRQAERNIEEKIGPDLQSIRSQRAMQQVAPAIQEAQQTVVTSMAEGMGEEFSTAMAESPEKFSELLGNAPDVRDAAIQIGGIADAAIEQMARLHAGIERADQKNPNHARFFSFIEGLEQAAANGEIEPPEIKGRIFATREEYVAMTPRQQSKAWTVAHFEEFPKLLASYAKTRIKAKIEENDRMLEALAKRKGWVKASPETPKPSKEKPSKKVEDVEEEDDPAPTTGSRDSRGTKPTGADDPPPGISPDLWRRAFPARKSL
jgi:hypothetical protein